MDVLKSQGLSNRAIAPRLGVTENAIRKLVGASQPIACAQLALAGITRAQRQGNRRPEVKTLRRRLTRLAAHHRAEQLGAELARLRVSQRGHLMGFLYIDGHVRAYHGQRAIASSAYVARRHLAMPASSV